MRVADFLRSETPHDADKILSELNLTENSSLREIDKAIGIKINRTE